jgi:nicotinamide mononucleotide adenylyltransferase
LRGKLDEMAGRDQLAQREIQERDDQRDEIARMLKNTEFEVEKVRRIMASKEDEWEGERRRFMQKWEKKVEEQERER